MSSTTVTVGALIRAACGHRARELGFTAPASNPRLDDAAVGDRFHVEHHGDSDGVIFESGKVNGHKHQLWRNGQAVPQYQYRKIRIEADGKIKIRTFTRELTIAEDSESQPGMRSGHLESSTTT